MNRTRLKYYLRALGIGIIVTALLMGYSQGQPQMTDEEILRRAAELELESQGEVLADLANASPAPGAALEPTAEPAVSAAPKPAAESTASPTPEFTEEPASGATPKPTAEPASGATPKPTEEPAPGATPKPTAEPASGATPKPTAEPASGATPKPTAEPASGATPKPTEEPASGATPKPTAEPASGATPKPTTEPVDSPSQAEDVVVLVISRGESSVTVSKNLQELGLVEDFWAFDRFLCDKGYDHSIITGTHEIPLGATHEEIAGIICKICKLQVKT